MGRLLVCVPLASAALVGCLLRPTSSQGPHDAARADAINADANANADGAASATPCADAASAVDPLDMGSCGAGYFTGAPGQAQASGGKLSLQAAGKLARCTWGVQTAGFPGVVVKVPKAQHYDPAELSITTYGGAPGTYGLDAYDYGWGIEGDWSMALQPPTPAATPTCLRIRVASGGMLVGEYFDGSSWQAVASVAADLSAGINIHLGVSGSGAATFDNFDYIDPAAR